MICATATWTPLNDNVLVVSSSAPRPHSTTFIRLELCISRSWMAPLLQTQTKVRLGRLRFSLTSMLRIRACATSLYTSLSIEKNGDSAATGQDQEHKRLIDYMNVDKKGIERGTRVHARDLLIATWQQSAHQADHSHITMQVILWSTFS